jgi:hypothetical protein
METAARFEFRDLNKQLDIAGQVFTIATGDVEALTAAQGLVERLEQVDLSTLESAAYHKLANEIITAIDHVLGEGGTSKALAGRRVNIIDLIDLLKFVLEQATGGFSEAVDAVVSDLVVTVPED